MSNITELLEAFDEAAQDWGWQEDQGFRRVEESRAAYLKTRQALVDAIRGLERDAERYKLLRDGNAGEWAICEFNHDDGLFYENARGAKIIDAAIDAILYPGVDIDAVHRGKE